MHMVWASAAGAGRSGGGVLGSVWRGGEVDAERVVCGEVSREERVGVEGASASAEVVARTRSC